MWCVFLFLTMRAMPSYYFYNCSALSIKFIIFVTIKPFLIWFDLPMSFRPVPIVETQTQVRLGFYLSLSLYLRLTRLNASLRLTWVPSLDYRYHPYWTAIPKMAKWMRGYTYSKRTVKNSFTFSFIKICRILWSS